MSRATSPLSRPQESKGGNTPETPRSQNGESNNGDENDVAGPSNDSEKSAGEDDTPTQPTRSLRNETTGRVIISPNERDILILPQSLTDVSRIADVCANPGNYFFRQLLAHNKKWVSICQEAPQARFLLCCSIVESLCVMGGRFLRWVPTNVNGNSNNSTKETENQSTGVWLELSIQRALSVTWNYLQQVQQQSTAEDQQEDDASALPPPFSRKMECLESLIPQLLSILKQREFNRGKEQSTDANALENTASTKSSTAKTSESVGRNASCDDNLADASSTPSAPPSTTNKETLEVKGREQKPQQQEGPTDVADDEKKTAMGEATETTVRERGHANDKLDAPQDKEAKDSTGRPSSNLATEQETDTTTTTTANAITAAPVSLRSGDCEQRDTGELPTNSTRNNMMENNVKSKKEEVSTPTNCTAASATTANVELNHSPKASGEPKVGNDQEESASKSDDNTTNNFGVQTNSDVMEKRQGVVSSSPSLDMASTVRDCIVGMEGGNNKLQTATTANTNEPDSAGGGVENSPNMTEQQEQQREAQVCVVEDDPMCSVTEAESSAINVEKGNVDEIRDSAAGSEQKEIEKINAALDSSRHGANVERSTTLICGEDCTEDEKSKDTKTPGADREISHGAALGSRPEPEENSREVQRRDQISFAPPAANDNQSDHEATATADDPLTKGASVQSSDDYSVIDSRVSDTVETNPPAHSLGTLEETAPAIPEKAFTPSDQMDPKSPHHTGGNGDVARKRSADMPHVENETTLTGIAQEEPSVEPNEVAPGSIADERTASPKDDADERKTPNAQDKSNCLSEEKPSESPLVALSFPANRSDRSRASQTRNKDSKIGFGDLEKAIAGACSGMRKTTRRVALSIPATPPATPIDSYTDATPPESSTLTTLEVQAPKRLLDARKEEAPTKKLRVAVPQITVPQSRNVQGEGNQVACPSTPPSTPVVCLQHKDEDPLDAIEPSTKKKKRRVEDSNIAHAAAALEKMDTLLPTVQSVGNSLNGRSVAQLLLDSDQIGNEASRADETRNAIVVGIPEAIAGSKQEFGVEVPPPDDIARDKPATTEVSTSKVGDDDASSLRGTSGVSDGKHTVATTTESETNIEMPHKVANMKLEKSKEDRAIPIATTVVELDSIHETDRTKATKRPEKPIESSSKPRDREGSSVQGSNSSGKDTKDSTNRTSPACSTTDGKAVSTAEAHGVETSPITIDKSIEHESAGLKKRKKSHDAGRSDNDSSHKEGGGFFFCRTTEHAVTTVGTRVNGDETEVDRVRADGEGGPGGTNALAAKLVGASSHHKTPSVEDILKKKTPEKATPDTTTVSVSQVGAAATAKNCGAHRSTLEIELAKSARNECAQSSEQMNSDKCDKGAAGKCVVRDDSRGTRKRKLGIPDTLIDCDDEKTPAGGNSKVETTAQKSHEKTMTPPSNECNTAIHGSTLEPSTPSNDSVGKMTRHERESTLGNKKQMSPGNIASSANSSYGLKESDTGEAWKEDTEKRAVVESPKGSHGKGQRGRKRKLPLRTKCVDDKGTTSSHHSQSAANTSEDDKNGKSSYSEEPPDAKMEEVGSKRSTTEEDQLVASDELPSSSASPKSCGEGASKEKATESAKKSETQDGIGKRARHESESIDDADVGKKGNNATELSPHVTDSLSSQTAGDLLKSPQEAKVACEIAVPSHAAPSKELARTTEEKTKSEENCDGSEGKDTPCHALKLSGQRSPATSREEEGTEKICKGGDPEIGKGDDANVQLLSKRQETASPKEDDKKLNVEDVGQKTQKTEGHGRESSDGTGTQAQKPKSAAIRTSSDDNDDPEVSPTKETKSSHTKTFSPAEDQKNGAEVIAPLSETHGIVLSPSQHSDATVTEESGTLSPSLESYLPDAPIDTDENGGISGIAALVEVAPEEVQKVSKSLVQVSEGEGGSGKALTKLRSKTSRKAPPTLSPSGDVDVDHVRASKGSFPVEDISAAAFKRDTVGTSGLGGVGAGDAKMEIDDEGMGTGARKLKRKVAQTTSSAVDNGGPDRVSEKVMTPSPRSTSPTAATRKRNASRGSKKPVADLEEEGAPTSRPTRSGTTTKEAEGKQSRQHSREEGSKRSRSRRLEEDEGKSGMRTRSGTTTNTKSKDGGETKGHQGDLKQRAKKKSIVATNDTKNKRARGGSSKEKASAGASKRAREKEVRISTAGDGRSDEANITPQVDDESQPETKASAAKDTQRKKASGENPSRRAKAPKKDSIVRGSSERSRESPPSENTRSATSYPADDADTDGGIGTRRKSRSENKGKLSREGKLSKAEKPQTASRSGFSDQKTVMAMAAAAKAAKAAKAAAAARTND